MMQASVPVGFTQEPGNTSARYGGCLLDDCAISSGRIPLTSSVRFPLLRCESREPVASNGARPKSVIPVEEGSLTEYSSAMPLLVFQHRNRKHSQAECLHCQ